MTAPGHPPGPSLPGSLATAAGIVTLGTVAARVSGFVRVVVVAAVLGTTFVGNTYQSANLVSNLLFELLAAGLLSSVLVPPLTRRLAGGDRAGAERLAGSILGVGLAVLGLVTVIGLIARPAIMALLTLVVTDPELRRQEVALGSFLLVLFLPQVLLYAVGSVATALLHASNRFAAAAFAPVANNVLVIATMAVFWMLAEGEVPTLDLSLDQRLVLGLGTTAGVVAMTIVPLVALRRAGLSLRPRWDPRHADLGLVVRAGAWAAGGLALIQVLIVTTLVLANQVEGGVVAYHIAFQVFLLPFAVLAYPVITTLFPRLAAIGKSGSAAAFAAAAGRGLRLLVIVALPASALLVALAQPALRVIEVGQLDRSGAMLAGRLLGAYGLGLAGYAGLHYLTRVFYALDDARTPTVVMGGVALGGSLLMVGWFSMVTGPDRVVVLGLSHSVACTAGTAVLAWKLRHRMASSLDAARTTIIAAVWAALGGGAAWVTSQALPTTSRVAAGLAVAAGSAAGIAVFAAGQVMAGSEEMAEIREGTRVARGRGRGPSRPMKGPDQRDRGGPA